MITLPDLDFLTSAQGGALLDMLATQDLSEGNRLALVASLRKSYTQTQVGSAITLAYARARAIHKFGAMADKLYFTPDSVEQASDPHIRAYRAGQFPDSHVYDFCCGVGADSFALADVATSIIGVDNDPVRVAMARLNADVLGMTNAQFIVADVTTTDLPPHHAFFFDPARRDADGGRISHVEAYLPPLSTITHWDGFGAVKLSPAVDIDEIRGYDGTVEFISVAGDLKEAVLWRDGASHRTKATMFLDGVAHHWEQSANMPADKPLSMPRAWLIEPDPALIRAGLVQDVAMQMNAFMLDETIAYLTADEKPSSQWIRAWQVLDWMPFHLKRLRAYLRERDVGRVTVKKRGSPITPESLIAQLKLKGTKAYTLVLTRYLGNPVILVCAEHPE